MYFLVAELLNSTYKGSGAGKDREGAMCMWIILLAGTDFRAALLFVSRDCQALPGQPSAPAKSREPCFMWLNLSMSSSVGLK